MNITETDLTIAAALYPVLVDCARQNPARKLTYGSLLEEAKARFPNLDAVQMAIPISLGRRLDVVRIFLDSQKYPNLTSLIVNADTGEVGSAFGADPERVRAEVGAFDWSSVSRDFDLHIAGLREAVSVRKKPKLSREEAKEAMALHYRKNQASYPKDVGKKREKIIEMIRDGFSAEDAFKAQVTDHG